MNGVTTVCVPFVSHLRCTQASWEGRQLAHHAGTIPNFSLYWLAYVNNVSVTVPLVTVLKFCRYRGPQTLDADSRKIMLAISR